jgi:hypothetical protein
MSRPPGRHPGRFAGESGPDGGRGRPGRGRQGRGAGRARGPDQPGILRALQAQTAPDAEPAKSAPDGSLAKSLGQAWERTRENAAWAGAKVGEQAAAVGGWLSRACAWIGGCLQTGWAWASGACGRAAAGVAAVCNTLPALLMLLWKYRKPLLIALTVGLVVGLGSYWAGPAVSAMLSGLAGFVGALVINLVGRLRAVMEAVRLPGHWAS